MKKTTIFINGKPYNATESNNVLEIAVREGIQIPHFCWHPDWPAEASCRICLVEEEETGRIETSCSLKCRDGLRVLIDSPKVQRLRKENLELLLPKHKEYCPKCQAGLPCNVAEIIEKYGAISEKYTRDLTGKKVFKMGNAAEFDPRLCIACGHCVHACEDIGIGYLKIDGNDSQTRATCTDCEEIDCIYCGQCTVSCPTGAIREQNQIAEVEAVLADPKKITIVQTAPAVRVSIGEEFGLEGGKNLAPKMYTAYRELGFDHIFDVNFGADITTLVEAEELVERIEKNEHLPMFTSCCPGWVKFVEFYTPELIPHLTTARSPQIHSGGAYKTWWAQKMGIDPKDIVVVSIMPCTSKKHEAKRDVLNIDGNRPVDYVLTTREIALLLKKNKINLLDLPESEVDLFGEHSGAGAIYGASGGVMESAFRTAYKMLTDEEFPGIDLKAVRGSERVKKAEVEVAGKKLRVAVVATPKNMREVLLELKDDPEKYHYIEVMSCPGGCIGGGGQPIPSTKAKIQKRMEGTYDIDKSKKRRRAHENKLAVEFVEYAKSLPKAEGDALLYTTYSKKVRGE